VPESLQLFSIGMVLTSPLWAIVITALVIRPFLMWAHGKVRARRPRKPERPKVERRCDRHNYEWICTMCGGWYRKRHWYDKKCHCGFRQLFQKCTTCGRRGPNGG
jgi:hypothetical protein